MDTEDFVLETKDHLDLQGKIWIPKEGLKAVVLLIHGLGEHINRYHHVAKYLAEHGYALMAADLRGHGKSDGLRGHVPSYDVLLSDIDLIIQKVRERFPNLPLFLYGHSMGGSIALNYVIRRKPDLTGVVVTSPGLRTGTPVSPITLGLGKILYNLAPKFQLDNGLDVQNLSHDNAVITQYKSDPLTHPKISARWGLDFLESGEYALQHANEFSLPLLLYVGSRDHIVSPAAVQEFGKNAPNCTVVVWEGLYHETHNEAEKDIVLKNTVSWLDEKLILDQSH